MESDHKASLNIKEFEDDPINKKTEKNFDEKIKKFQ